MSVGGGGAALGPLERRGGRLWTGPGGRGIATALGGGGEGRASGREALGGARREPQPPRPPTDGRRRRGAAPGRWRVPGGYFAPRSNGFRNGGGGVAQAGPSRQVAVSSQPPPVAGAIAAPRGSAIGDRVPERVLKERGGSPPRAPSTLLSRGRDGGPARSSARGDRRSMPTGWDAVASLSGRESRPFG